MQLGCVGGFDFTPMASQCLLGMSLRASRDTTQVMLGVSLRARWDHEFYLASCDCRYLFLPLVQSSARFGDTLVSGK